MTRPCHGYRAARPRPRAILACHRRANRSRRQEHGRLVSPPGWTASFGSPAGGPAPCRSWPAWQAPTSTSPSGRAVSRSFDGASFLQPPRGKRTTGSRCATVAESRQEGFALSSRRVGQPSCQSATKHGCPAITNIRANNARYKANLPHVRVILAMGRGDTVRLGRRWIVFGRCASLLRDDFSKEVQIRPLQKNGFFQGHDDHG